MRRSARSLTRLSQGIDKTFDKCDNTGMMKIKVTASVAAAMTNDELNAARWNLWDEKDQLATTREPTPLRFSEINEELDVIGDEWERRPALPRIITFSKDC